MAPALEPLFRSLLYLLIAVLLVRWLAPVPDTNFTQLPAPRPAPTPSWMGDSELPPQTPRQAGIDALSQASKDGNIDEVERLLAHGAPINGVSSSGNRPLCQALEMASHASQSADYEGRPSDRDEPLIRLMLQRGADPNGRNGYWEKGHFVPSGRSPLDIALGGGHEGYPRLVVVRILVHAGADVNQSFARGMTPLAAAAVDGRRPFMELLLRAGARINGRDKKGCAALMYAAAFSGSRESGSGRSDAGVLQFLLSRGAAVNQQDYQGRTALMDAIAGPHLSRYVDEDDDAIVGRYQLDAMRVLLDAGVRVDLPDKQGRTALMWALRDTEFGSGNGDSETMQQYPKGKEAAILLLLKRGANPNARDHRGWTPLMHALQTYYRQADAQRPLEPIRLLLKHGADVSLRARDGTGALDLAYAEPEVTKLLRAAGARDES